jgi:hypothetical protein
LGEAIQPASFFQKRPVVSVKETYPAGFPKPCQRVSKAHSKKLAKSSAEFLSHHFCLLDGAGTLLYQRQTDRHTHMLNIMRFEEGRVMLALAGGLSRPLTQESNIFFLPQGPKADLPPVTMCTHLGTMHTQLSGWSVGQRERARGESSVTDGRKPYSRSQQRSLAFSPDGTSSSTESTSPRCLTWRHNVYSIQQIRTI